MGSEPLRTAREVISRLTATTQSQSHGKKMKWQHSSHIFQPDLSERAVGGSSTALFLMVEWWRGCGRLKAVLGCQHLDWCRGGGGWGRVGGWSAFFSPSTNSATGVFFKCRLLTTPAGQLQCEASRLPQLGKINDYAECMECWIRWSFCYAMFINSGINVVWELCSR